MLRDVRAYRIKPGSLIVIDGGATEQEVSALVEELRRVCGHDEFVVVRTDSSAGPTLEVVSAPPPEPRPPPDPVDEE